MKPLLTVALTVAISSFATNSSAIAINFSDSADDQNVSAYIADGVTVTISNPINYNGDQTSFASDYDGLAFSAIDQWFSGYGHTDIDTFDISFDKNVMIDSFVIDWTEPSGSVGFSISGTNGTSAFLDISDSTTYPFDSGSIPVFLANQTYTFDFTATGDLTTQISELHFTEVSNVPVPAAAWLLGSGLIGLIGMRKKTTQASAL